LDLFIWRDALAGALERAKRVFMQMICGGAFEIPSVIELTATGVPFMEAVRQHGSTIAQMKARQRCLLEDEMCFVQVSSIDQVMAEIEHEPSHTTAGEALPQPAASLRR
jgi:hypothetical protein